MFKLTLLDIKNSMTKDKLLTLTLWDRYILRKPSYYISYFLYNKLNLGANAVSVLSIIVATIAFLLMFTLNNFAMLIAIVLLNVWALLDCADGNIARALYVKYNRTNKYGELYDAMSGCFVIAFLWISLGYYCFELLDNIFYLVFGALTSIMGIFSRLLYLKTILISNSNIVSQKGILYKCYENFEIGSFLMPSILFFFLIDSIELIIILYFPFNLLLMIYAFFNVYKKSKNIDASV